MPTQHNYIIYSRRHRVRSSWERAQTGEANNKARIVRERTSLQQALHKLPSSGRWSRETSNSFPQTAHQTHLARQNRNPCNNQTNQAAIGCITTCRLTPRSQLCQRKSETLPRRQIPVTIIKAKVSFAIISPPKEALTVALVIERLSKLNSLSRTI